MREVIAIDKLVPHPGNIRRRDMGDLEGMARSLAELGLIEPLLVRPWEDGHYQVIAGHRRLAAAQLALSTLDCQHDLANLDCTVRELTDIEALEVMLVENLQREDVHPLDEAEAFHRLAEAGWTQRKIAERTGVSQGHISKSLRRRGLPDKLAAELHRKPTDAEVKRGDSVGITLAQADVLLELAEHPTRMVAVFDRWNQERDWMDLESEVAHEMEAIAGETKKVYALGKFAEDGVENVIQVDRINWYESYRKLGRGVDQVNMTLKQHRILPCHAGVVDRMGAAHEVCIDPTSHGDRYKGHMPSRGGRAALTDTEKAERALVRERNRQLKAAHETRGGFVAALVAAAAPATVETALMARQWTAELGYDSFSRTHADIAAGLLGVKPAKNTWGQLQHQPALIAYGAASLDNAGRLALALTLALGEAKARNDSWDEITAAHLQYLTDHGYTPADVETKALKGKR